MAPVEVTEDVPDDAIIVAPGNEFLIAPSAPQTASVFQNQSLEMRQQWRVSHASGSTCGCMIARMMHTTPIVIARNK